MGAAGRLRVTRRALAHLPRTAATLRRSLIERARRPAARTHRGPGRRASSRRISADSHRTGSPRTAPAARAMVRPVDEPVSRERWRDAGPKYRKLRSVSATDSFCPRCSTTMAGQATGQEAASARWTLARSAEVVAGTRFRVRFALCRACRLMGSTCSTRATVLALRCSSFTVRGPTRARGADYPLRWLKGRRVVAYRRGAGRSVAAPPPDYRRHVPDAVALIEHCGPPVSVIGWSSGGAVALALAERRPDLVCCLVLAEPLYHGLRNATGGLLRAIAVFRRCGWCVETARRPRASGASRPVGAAAATR